jgi:hypothetical protein
MLSKARGETKCWNVLDAEQSIILGNTLTTSRSTSLDLSSAEGNDEVGDDGVLGLTRSVRDHDTPTVGLRQLSTVKIPFSSRVRFPGGRKLRLDGLGDGSDLVDLEQETVASLLLDSSLDTEGVGDSKVVADDLDATFGGEVSPSLPIVLIEGILDGDDGVLLNVAEVEVGELDTSEPLCGVGIGVLEVEVVLAILVELGGGNIESDLDLALITGLLDGLAEELKRLVCARHVGGESSLITNVDS